MVEQLTSRIYITTLARDNAQVMQSDGFSSFVTKLAVQVECIFHARLSGIYLAEPQQYLAQVVEGKGAGTPVRLFFRLRDNWFDHAPGKPKLSLQHESPPQIQAST